jgi:adenosylcobinamide-phosphate synthase
MKHAAWLVAGACCLDALIGDPPGIPHPVRVMGAAIDLGDRALNGNGAGSRLAGAALALGVIGASAAVGAFAQRSPLASIVLGATTLAARDLLGEAHAVCAALECGDLTLARSRVARIVGRDTADLDASQIARAAIETLGESACDGIVAPLFWLALGGVSGALAFKAASTLDSMIGHREPRYLRFGAVAARTDDALNFIPARITALLIALAGDDPLAAARLAWRDAPRHASPNAGWPEAALAAVLDVRLGGPNQYAGVRADGATFNAAGRQPDVTDVRAAMRVIRGVAVGAAVCAVGAHV